MEIFRDLPKDLIEDEILTHVPATYLRGLGSTCKRWNRLFNDDRRFAGKHAEKAAKQFMVLMLTRAYRICPAIVDLDGKIPSFELKSELSLVDPKHPAARFDVDIPFQFSFDHASAQVDVDAVLHCGFKYPGAQFRVGVVFHCDGLLLCTAADKSRFVVWNLFTGETRWFQPSNKGVKGRNIVLGYGKDKSYKILSFYHRKRDYEIYEFSSDTWRVVDEIIAPGWSLGYTGIYVSLKGSTYSFATDETKTQQSVSLIKFDYSAEKFVPVALPYPSSFFGTVSLSVVKDEKLSVLLKGAEDTSKTEIWVSNKVDERTPEVVSWSLVWALDLSPDLQVFWGSSYLLDEEKKVAVISAHWIDLKDETETIDKDTICIVGEDNEATVVDFGLETTDGCYAVILNYVPSLVQIEQAGGGKRKRADM
ncbi:unnamed protein product [Microthlaspi erraticum]|uniref:F-box associated beta-propeller type 1 domain-containing protein n=1 Tax=Microthlaspi erraticum TaxID=1685480 RepID=A0A6D2JS80_9BRAS|nr:unnamed protein product [Microthlaspi erraticum]